MEKLVTLAWVCAGGAAGSGLRFLTTEAAARWLGAGLPWGTLAVNVAGSFAAGFLSQWVTQTGWPGPLGRAALMTGVLGGFTTYSAFNTETLRLAQKGAFGLGGLYLAATVLGCLCAGLLGMGLVRWLAAKPASWGI